MFPESGQLPFTHSMKQLEDIKSIAIIGAGTMGSGIAQVCALTGYNTIVYDLENEMVQKARSKVEANLNKAVEKEKITAEQKEVAFRQIKFTHEFGDLKADLIIEAIVEKLEPKIKLFNELNDLNGEECVMASNTSSIPITRIASGIPNPERIVGMHFFNPAHIMKLVEVISGKATSPDINTLIGQLAEKMGKQPVMANDSPGFIVNRVARHYYVEALQVLEDDVTSFEEIDNLMEATGFKMGPFRLMDLLGVDNNLRVTQSMYESFNPKKSFSVINFLISSICAGAS